MTGGPGNPMLVAALEAAGRGWPVFPLGVRSKLPLISKAKEGRGVHDASTDVDQIRAWWARAPQANIGLACGGASGLAVLDVDPRHGGEESLRRLLEGRKLPDTLTVRTGGRGSHYYFADIGVRLKNGGLRGYPGLDLKTVGGYVVLPPSVHESGELYVWDGFDPARDRASPMPAWLLERLALPKAMPHRPPSGNGALQALHGNVAPYAEAALRGECERVARAQAGTRNNTLNRAAFSLGQLIAGGAVERERVEARLSAAAFDCGLETDDGELAVIATIKSGIEAGMTEPRTGPEREVQRNGAARSMQLAGKTGVAGPGKNGASEPLNPTDLGNAERFAAGHAESVRYCHPWGAWMIYDGARWTRDRSGEVVQRYKETVRGLALEAYNASSEESRRELLKHARQSEAQRRIMGALELAKAERTIAVLPEAFDSEATRYLLNVRNGTLDLRTGQLRSHRRDDLITRLAPGDFEPNARCPTWDRFLAEVVPDEEVRAFLQRFIGYALTGAACEQVFCLLYGTGANGKSTFLETLATLLGDYAHKSEFETFLESTRQSGNKDAPRPSVLALAGRRLVVAIEAAQGRRLDVATVKELTGGDTITARGMYHGEMTSFRPQFAFFLAANHRPEIREASEAIWRRVLQIPFTITISEDQRDRELLSKLTAWDELAGILRWAVEGCRAWQRAGLVPPRAVQHATAAYRAEQDTIAPFLAQRCTRDPRVRITKKKLRDEYHGWCRECDEEPLSDKAFARAMEEHGFESARGHGGTRLWLGLRLSDMLDTEPSSRCE